MLTLFTGSASAETFTAGVIGVTDGDTLTIRRAGRSETVRLCGIDAPERGQPLRRARVAVGDQDGAVDAGGHVGPELLDALGGAAVDGVLDGGLRARPPSQT